MNREILIGTFASDRDLLSATQAARQRGFAILDAYTPYPVHGLDDAMGLRPSRLGIVCFVCGLVGVVSALAFQQWTLAIDWPINIGGRPFNSWPAFVPVTFEVLVLFAGFGVVFAFLGVCRLFPGKRAPVIDPRISIDRFALAIEAAGAALDVDAVFDLFHKHHAVAVQTRAALVGEPTSSTKSTKGVNVVLLVLLGIGMALNWTLSIDHGRPNVEFMPEMVRAVPYESFAEHPGLPNKAVLQPPADGTIARGQLPLHYQATPQDAERAGEKLHNPFKIGDKHWQPRGAQVYANFCGVCHGPGGAGDGPVSQRGVPPPPSLLATKKVKTADGSEKDVEKFKDGQLFHIITFGQNNMAAYGAQLSREDRWAVILHLRQLQNVQGAGK